MSDVSVEMFRNASHSYITRKLRGTYMVLGKKRMRDIVEAFVQCWPVRGQGIPHGGADWLAHELVYGWVRRGKLRKPGVLHLLRARGYGNVWLYLMAPAVERVLQLMIRRWWTHAGGLTYLQSDLTERVNK